MLVKCLECQKEFEKRVCDIKGSPNHYCTRSCAASRNNRLKPRRVKTNRCCLCNVLIRSGPYYCQECSPLSQDMTIAAASERYKKHHNSSAFALIRLRARRVAHDLGWNSCKRCGYDKHVEIAHVKAISSYPKDTLISIVNDPTNLLPLCPNCHWEQDNL